MQCSQSKLHSRAERVVCKFHSHKNRRMILTDGANYASIGEVI
jgi:hypothetical protein